MANELNIALTTGLTVTAQRYQAGASVGSPISCPEVGTTGFYSGDMTGSAGTYQLVFQSGAATVGTGSIVWSGTAEIPPSTFNPATDTVARVTLTDTATTLTNAPTVPSASQIATQVRTELGTELGRIDATVSSRLASASYTAPANSDIAAIKTKTDALPSDPADQSLLEAAIAGVTAPSASTVASAVRTELATELARVDAAISTRATPANIPTADITAIKAKTDALNTDRLAQVSTVSTNGAQLAAALS
jgi:hypothetical protein